MRSQFDDDGSGPDVADVMAEVSDVVGHNLRRYGPMLSLVLLGLLAATGVYSVEPGEVGVVRRFGEERGHTQPGLHYRLPLVETVDEVNVERVRRAEVGFRNEETVGHEALMLTGDENIVEVRLVVQYRVSDPSRFLFRSESPEETLHTTAEVALRTLVGRTNIDDVMTTGRGKVQDETRLLLQKLVDDYECGIEVTGVKLDSVDAPDEVKDAFNDVTRAREEKEKLVNEAEGYREDRIPRARGEARQKERAAEGYKEQRVLRANGDAAKFKAILAEYKNAKEVTRQRLYLETMERVLAPLKKKTIVDEKLGSRVLPLLSIGQGAAKLPGGKP